MSRLNDANAVIAKEIIGRYPRPKSALIPLLHLSQEQNGYITREAMVHLGEWNRNLLRNVPFRTSW